jgi:hypothetical protein
MSHLFLTSCFSKGCHQSSGVCFAICLDAVLKVIEGNEKVYDLVAMLFLQSSFSKISLAINSVSMNNDIARKLHPEKRTIRKS